jgi:hypothetical protein
MFVCSVLFLLLFLLLLRLFSLLINAISLEAKSNSEFIICDPNCHDLF